MKFTFTKSYCNYWFILAVWVLGCSMLTGCGGGGSENPSANNDTAGQQSVWYMDRDGDGYGDAAMSMTAVSQPLDHVLNNRDCNDNDADINPFVLEICGDHIDQNCDGSDAMCWFTWYADEDGDGYGNPDIPLQADAQPTGYVINNSDCNDDDPLIHPAAIELVGDGIDNNCDGVDIVGGDDTHQCTGQYNATAGAYLLFNNDYTFSMHNGEYHAYGTYTQDGNGVTLYVDNTTQTGAFAPDCSFLAVGGLTYPKEP